MTGSLLEAVRSRLTVLHSGTRIGQFVSVGAVGATVDLLTLYLLVEFTALGSLEITMSLPLEGTVTIFGPVIAKAVSWELAIIVIFVINERWTFSTFGRAGPRALVRRFLRSNLVRSGGFLVTLTVFMLLLYQFSIWYLLANAVGIVAGFFVNYSFESLYTWEVQYDER